MPTLKHKFLQSAAIAAILLASASAASAANVTPANVNVLNLLSPFLGLNATAVGQTTLSDNLSAAISVNNGASLTLQDLSFSDKNLLGSASNTVTGLSGVFGVAANLGGGLPSQPAPTGGTVPGVQPIGGLGATLGAAYDAGVNGFAAGTSTTLTNTVSLLTKAYSFTSSGLGVAKYYFANGTTNGTATAVAPSGYSLPTFNGLPNTTNSVYDLAYGVTNTEPGQNIYGNSRPAQVSSSIKLFDPTALNGINTNPSFPSGHTTYAYTDSILIGMMTPQSYQAMLVRASEYANSRIVLGVHYPLDIIASRSLVTYDLAQAFTNPAYINNAATTGTAVNLPQLYTAANAELSPVLCGSSNCAADPTNPYAPSSANAAAYASRLTYGLPTLTYAQAPKEQAPSGGPDASILLAPIFGGSTTAAATIAPSGGLYGNLATSTINQIIVNTEGQALAAFSGTSLSYWSRVNLYAAIGYFQGVTGTLTTAAGDAVKTDVTVAAGGVIDVTGLFAVLGNFDVNAGGALGATLDGLADYSQVQVGKTSNLDGALDVTLGSGFELKVAQAFDLVESAGSLTDDISALYLDGAACSALGGETFRCGSDLIALDVITTGDDALQLKVLSTPEPATWAMMLAGFAGLGFAGYRRVAPRALA